MGYAVLHLSKASGSDSGMSAHIERKVKPKNADQERTHLNRELIDFPEGVDNRTESIQHRLDTVGLKRKIGKNQVRAIRILLSGSPDDMKRIEQSGKLNDWCSDNLKWLEQTFGAQNVVSAVVHLDEKTPHIHATIVPVVTGQRRKAKSDSKPTNTVRLCADDVMSRVKLKEYQNTYAEQMAKYGLQRGIEGSEAKHISTSQYYRDLMAQTSELEQQKEQAQKELSKIKSKTDVAEVVKSIFSNSKIDTLKDEIECLKKEKEEREKQVAKMESELKEELKKQETTIQKLKDKLARITNIFPQVDTLLNWEVFMRKMRLPMEVIKRLLNRETVRGSGEIYSPEHGKSFKTENAELKLEPQKDELNRLRLTINKTDIHHWFELKNNQWIKSVTGIEQKERTQNNQKINPS